MKEASNQVVSYIYDNTNRAMKESLQIPIIMAKLMDALKDIQRTNFLV